MLARVFAILPTLGMYEMFLLLLIGLLLYGRNLPQAGRTMGRFVAQLKRGFQDFKDQMDRDESLREVRKTIEDTTREVRNIAAVPRAIANPVQELRSLAHHTMHEPVLEHPEGVASDDPHGSHEPHEPPPPAVEPPPATPPHTPEPDKSHP